MWPPNDGERQWNIMLDWTLLKQTSICVVNQTGTIVQESVVDLILRRSPRS